MFVYLFVVGKVGIDSLIFQWFDDYVSSVLEVIGV